METYRGEVQLTGFVNSPAERQRATEIAQGVAGVRQVANNLQIKPAPPQAVGSPGGTVNPQSSRANTGTGASDLRPLDTTTTTTPRATTNLDDYRASNWQLSTSNGRAVIRGTVQRDTERDAIERKVRELPGITAVDNQLEVRGANR